MLIMKTFFVFNKTKQKNYFFAANFFSQVFLHFRISLKTIKAYFKPKISDLLKIVCCTVHLLGNILKLRENG